MRKIGKIKYMRKIAIVKYMREMAIVKYSWIKALRRARRRHMLGSKRLNSNSLACTGVGRPWKVRAAISRYSAKGAA